MKKHRSVRGIAAGGIMTALALAVLYGGAVLPGWALALAALAGLFPAAVFLTGETVMGLISYAAAALLGFLLLPDKGCVFLFSIFFGYYAVIKLTAEKRLRRMEAWAVKLAVFNAALTVTVLLLPALLTVSVIRSLSGLLFYLAVYVLFNVVFIVFDLGYSRLISFARDRVLSHIQ